MQNVSWQMSSNSWQAYFWATNKTDAANKNFSALIDTMVTGNSKIEKINTITEDPDSIMLVVNQKKIKFIHSCKKMSASPPIQSQPSSASLAKEQERSLLLLIQKKQQAQRKWHSFQTQGSGHAKMPPKWRNLTTMPLPLPWPREQGQEVEGM